MIHSASSSVQEFSRAFRSREYWFDSATSRGRKRKSLHESTTPSKGEPKCFQVQQMPHKGGIGIISTRDIHCGEVLVSEFPILGIGVPDASHVVCETCLTPLGSLRVQLEGRSSSHISDKGTENLPLLDPDDDGPKFATICHEKRSCSYCATMWCSEGCQDSNKVLHDILLCCGQSQASTLNKESGMPKEKHHKAQFHFRKHAIQAGLEFLLAGQAFGAMVATVMKDTNTEWEITRMTDDKNFFWWREYSHPLWWNLGSTENNDKEGMIKRKKLCKESHGLLLQALQTSVSYIMKPESEDRKCFLSTLIQNICTLDHFGQILGMLQCNVMEIEFPSPHQQYISHLQGILEDEDDESGDEHGDSDHGEKENVDSKENISDIKSWLSRYFLMDGVRSSETLSVGSKSMGTTQQVEPTPISGSGLFPILTLANHDCDPNASIEFLEESNKGSLVALRNIPLGEEITITYTPNGDFDCGDEDGNRFEHFQPTRTWLYLNKRNDTCDSDSDVEHESNSYQIEEDYDSDESPCEERASADSHEDVDGNKAYEEDGCDASHNEEDSSDMAEGLLWTDRARALAGYGFICHCARCEHEKLHEDTPYCRK